MLIINKKYSNLLKGYQCAIELDQKLKTEWESKYKPELLSKLQERESEQVKDYQEKLSTWQESERQSIAQWEETEKIKLIEWESNEIVRQTSFATENSQNQDKNQLLIEQQKQKRSLWMILWISSVALCFVLLLVGLFVKVGVIFGILGFLSAMGVSIFSTVAFIFFIVNCFTRIKPIPGYIPAPKPQPSIRNVMIRPIEPAFSDSLLSRFSCPSVMSCWMERIQYKDEGKEYFRKFNQDNPEAANGIPGEFLLLCDHNALDNSSNTVIYIPGLKTNLQGDIDGISISHKGIWILESKYLIGKVIFRDGVWKQFVYKKQIGQHYMDGWEEKVLEKSLTPDDQLTKAVERIKTILSRYSQENPWVKKAINGVIVFTHDDVELDISNCSVPYINRMYLLDLYRNAPDIPELTFEKRLEIADIFLLKNRKFEKHEISAVQVAEEIYSNSKKSLEKLVNNFSIS